jgi:acyl dehydratase
MSELPVVRSLAELKELVGRETGVSRWLEIDQARVDRFAEVTGDDQFIHVDPERAARTPFKGTVAHGYLTLSLVTMLGHEREEGFRIELPSRMAVNMGSNRVRFPAPVPVGRRIRMRTRLVSVREGDGYVELVNEQTIEVEGGERPGMVAETVSRLYL